jgi:threonine 3-dehydrogenase
VNPYRLELAKKMGATLAVDVRHRAPSPRAQEQLGMKEGFDVGPGNVRQRRRRFATCWPTCATAARSPCSAFPEQSTVHRLATVIFNMLTIKGIYGREMYETWYKMTVMLQSGLNIAPIITHRFHIHRVPAGLRGHAPAFVPVVIGSVA